MDVDKREADYLAYKIRTALKRLEGWEPTGFSGVDQEVIGLTVTALADAIEESGLSSEQVARASDIQPATLARILEQDTNIAELESSFGKVTVWLDEQANKPDAVDPLETAYAAFLKGKQRVKYVRMVAANLSRFSSEYVAATGSNDVEVLTRLQVHIEGMAELLAEKDARISSLKAKTKELQSIIAELRERTKVSRGKGLLGEIRASAVEKIAGLLVNGVVSSAVIMLMAVPAIEGYVATLAGEEQGQEVRECMVELVAEAYAMEQA